jgi:hypothetical protein
MSDLYSSLNRLTKFSGEDKDYPGWKLQTDVVLAHHKLSEYGIPGVKCDKLPYTYNTGTPVIPALTAEHKAALEANAKTVCFVVQSFGSQSSLNLYRRCKTADWPGGLANDIFKELEDRHTPSTHMTPMNLQNKINAIKELTYTANPKLLFDEIEDIETQFSNTSAPFTLEHQKVAIWAACQKHYENVLTSLNVFHGANVTVNLLRTNVNAAYCARHNGVTKTDKVDDDLEAIEHALHAFNGRCNNCGNKGHKAADCRSNDDDGGNQGKLVCGRCSKKGHKAVDCFQDPANAAKKEAWFAKLRSKKGEAANSAIGNNRELVIMALQEKPASFTDKDLFHLDGAATCHIINYDDGLTNAKEAGPDDGVVGVNGEWLPAEKVGDLRCIMLTKDGDKIRGMTMRPVQYSKNACGNMFSEAKLIKEGWSVKKNSERAVLSKGGEKLVFDVKVYQGSGLMFAMRVKRVDCREETAMGAIASIQGAHDHLGHPGINEKEQEIAKPDEKDPEEKAKEPSGRVFLDFDEKEPEGKEKDPSGRVFLDIEAIKEGEDKVKNRVKVKLVEEIGGQVLFQSCVTEAAVPKVVCEGLRLLKDHGEPVKYLRMDNSIESMKIQLMINEGAYQLGVQVEMEAANGKNAASDANKESVDDNWEWDDPETTLAERKQGDEEASDNKEGDDILPELIATQDLEGDGKAAERGSKAAERSDNLLDKATTASQQDLKDTILCINKSANCNTIGLQEKDYKADGSGGNGLFRVKDSDAKSDANYWDQASQVSGNYQAKLESIGLKVKLPMKVMGDNKGVLELMNSQSTGGRTRHIDVRYYFLRDLQAEGLIELIWIAGKTNPADLFTKNLGGVDFERHTATFTGIDKYMTLWKGDGDEEAAASDD